MTEDCRWIFPIGEGLITDKINGRWSDQAFFDDEDTPVVWHPAQPDEAVSDPEIWKRWLNYLETDASAAHSLLVVARSRARHRCHASMKSLLGPGLTG